MRKQLIALLGLLLWAVPVLAQSPVAPSTVIGEINTQLPTNNTGRIDAKTLRGVLGDMVNSFTQLGLDKTSNPWRLCAWTIAGACNQIGTVNPSTGVVALSATADPGGINGQLQVNIAGALGGITPSGDLTFNPATGAFTINSAAVSSSKLASGAAVGNIGFTPIDTATRGIANGVPTLDSGGFVPLAQLPPSIAGGLAFEGNWDANTNTPTLVSSTGTIGQYYFVSVAGSTTLNGTSSWAVGDLVLFSSGVWNKIPGPGGGTGVSSVAGLSGAVSGASLIAAAGLATSGANTNITSLGGLTGNIALTSTGQRFTGDMSNATLASRFAFQTNVANGATVVNAIPNGSGSVGAFVVYSTAGMTNGNLGGLVQISNETQLIAEKIGTGTYGPLEFWTGGVERARFTAGGNFGIGNTVPAYSLDVVGDINATGTLRVNGTPFSTGLAHSGANTDITGLSNLSSGLTVLSGSSLNFNALGNTSGQRRAFIQEDASGRLAFAFTSDDGATLQSVGYINRDGSSTFGGGTTFAGLSDKTTYFPGVSTNVEATGTPGLDMAGCTTAASCGWFLFATPTAYPAAQTAPLRIDKHFPASGGTTGFTYNGLQVNTYTGLNDPSFVWGMQSVVYNNSLASTAAQQVATTGSIFKILGSQASGTNMSPSFGVFGECRDQTLAVNPTTGCGGAEFDTSSNVGSGADTNKQRYGIHIVGGVIGGTDTGVHVGGGLIILSGAEGAQIDTAVRFATGGGAAFGVGIDFTGAGSFFGNGAILLSSSNQQVIGWTDNTGAKDGTHGFSNFAASDNNWYWDNNSNSSTVFRGQSGDTRLTMTTSVVTISKTLNLGYSGSGPPGCTATGSIPIQINGAAHQLPYC